MSSGAVTSPEDFRKSSGANPKDSACGNVAVIINRSVPSTMESSRTFPRRLDRTEYNEPMPVKEEFKVNFKWLSIKRTGRVLYKHNEVVSEIQKYIQSST